jgi:Protein of unknown function (DUF3102)
MPVANRAHLAPDTGRTGEPIVDPKDRVTGVVPVVAEHAEKIRCLGKRVVADVIEIGRRLTECKKLLGHGNWGAWLDREFGWSDRQALNFMRVYELAESKSENFSDLHLPVSVLYLLAAPSTPPEVRKEVIEQAKRGEKLTHRKTIERVRLSGGKSCKSPPPAPNAAARPPDARAVSTPAGADATPPVDPEPKAEPVRRNRGSSDSVSGAVAIATRQLVNLMAHGMQAEPKRVACALRKEFPKGGPTDELIRWLGRLLAEMRAADNDTG